MFCPLCVRAGPIVIRPCFTVGQLDCTFYLMLILGAAREGAAGIKPSVPTGHG